MNYKDKYVAITGADGFLGSALHARLIELGAIVNVFDGDIRKPSTFKDLDYEFSYLFHFAAPSSQVLFKQSPGYCAAVTLTGFINAAKACERNGVRLVYPSTGLLSSSNRNEYATCKEICELYASTMDMDSIGLRIFATYGPGEGHKRHYASVPYLFARDMVNSRSPVIFGNGEQSRDFVYIDDVVESILHLAEEATEPIVDIGSGAKISFNDIAAEISNQLNKGIEPVFVDRPVGYVDETLADPTILHKYYKPEVKFGEGIKRLVNHLKENA